DDDDAPAGVSASVVSMPQAKAHPAPDIPQAAATPSEPEAKPEVSHVGKPLSASLQRMLDDLCKHAGVTKAALAERHPTVDSSNFNAIREELQGMIDATAAAGKE